MIEADFIQMNWRIDLLQPDESCLEKFPDLKDRFDGFMLDSVKLFPSITNDQLIRYVIYTYHKQSPFIRKINEIRHRKNQALIQVGYDFKQGVGEDVKEIINNENEKVGQIILRFLQFENNPKFAALMMQNDAYYKYNYRLAYTEVKNIKNTNEAIRDLAESIEALSHDVYSGDVTVNNFASSTALKGLILSPESNAHAHSKVSRL